MCIDFCADMHIDMYRIFPRVLGHRIFPRVLGHRIFPRVLGHRIFPKVLGEVRVGLFAEREIAAGTELTFDYQMVPHMPVHMPIRVTAHMSIHMSSFTHVLPSVRLLSAMADI